MERHAESIVCKLYLDKTEKEERNVPDAEGSSKDANEAVCASGPHIRPRQPAAQLRGQSSRRAGQSLPG